MRFCRDFAFARRRPVGRGSFSRTSDRATGRGFAAMAVWGRALESADRSGPAEALRRLRVDERVTEGVDRLVGPNGEPELLVGLRVHNANGEAVVDPAPKE